MTLVSLVDGCLPSHGETYFSPFLMTVTRVVHVSVLRKCATASHVKTLKAFYQLIWCIKVWYISVIFNVVSVAFSNA